MESRTPIMTPELIGFSQYPVPFRQTTPTTHLNVLRNPTHIKHYTDDYLSPGLHNASDAYTRLLQRQMKDQFDHGIDDALARRCPTFTEHRALEEQSTKELQLETHYAIKAANMEEQRMYGVGHTPYEYWEIKENVGKEKALQATQTTTLVNPGFYGLSENDSSSTLASEIFDGDNDDNFDDDDLENDKCDHIYEYDDPQLPNAVDTIEIYPKETPLEKPRYLAPPKTATREGRGAQCSWLVVPASDPHNPLRPSSNLPTIILTTPDGFLCTLIEPLYWEEAPKATRNRRIYTTEIDSTLICSRQDDLPLTRSAPQYLFDFLTNLRAIRKQVLRELLEEDEEHERQKYRNQSGFRLQFKHLISLRLKMCEFYNLSPVDNGELSKNPTTYQSCGIGAHTVEFCGRLKQQMEDPDFRDLLENCTYDVINTPEMISKDEVGWAPLKDAILDRVETVYTYQQTKFGEQIFWTEKDSVATALWKLKERGKWAYTWAAVEEELNTNVIQFVMLPLVEKMTTVGEDGKRVLITREERMMRLFQSPATKKDETTVQRKDDYEPWFDEEELDLAMLVEEI